MAVKRPASISLKTLASAVEKAASLVAGQSSSSLTAGLHISPTIIGKVARPKDFAEAPKIATSLTKSLTASGGPLASARAAQPATLIRGGVIICGFIAPELQLRE